MGMGWDRAGGFRRRRRRRRRRRPWGDGEYYRKYRQTYIRFRHILYATFYTPHFIRRILYATFYTPHFIRHILYATFYGPKYQQQFLQKWT